tara:strand:- start:22794 stop:24194 length:1401 start_codon:yes stop_codon:yes gene_type:complete
MLLMILLSFIVTGLIYFRHFQNENEIYHEERLKRKETAVNEAINYFLRDQKISEHTDSIVSLFDDKICELADINRLDINIYSLKGKLLIGSNPELFHLGLIPDTLPPHIMNQLSHKGDQLVVDRRVDTLRYLVSYDYVRNAEEKEVAIVNLPYFDNDNVIVEEQKSFLIQLSQIFLALFIISGLIAYLLSNYITSSLIAIGQKLKETRINDYKPLKWKYNDEIGALVKQYNKMLTELEESAANLAKQQREEAWKEMAKQVAHEIKNPLTPMRLNVQYLEKSLKTEEPEKLKEFTQGMISQIDTLTNIASAFSSFARMPDAKMEEVEAKDIILQSTLLFTDVNISFNCEDESLKIRGDKDQLLRVMNNLIKNAIQAIPEERETKIDVSIKQQGESVLISVKDNGTGVPEDKWNKIFEPSFTTKTKGMGLGLAMVKNIIEGLQGEIWFKTKTDEGTTFFISLPIARPN